MTAAPGQNAESINALALELREQPARPASAADLAAFCQKLREDSALADAIHRQSGLSLPVVRAGLDSTFAPLTPSYLVDLRDCIAGAADPTAEPVRLAFIHLAGNIFAAAAAPLIIAQLLGVPAIVRTSRRDDVLPKALAEGFETLPMSARCELVSFNPSDAACFKAAVQHADVIEAFGSDESVSALRSLCTEAQATATFNARGHGLGCALMLNAVEPSDYDALARDIAAYDQQGCLSPRVLYADGDLGAHARALHEALEKIELELPRGEVPAHIKAESSRWMATAAAVATTTLDGTTHRLVVDAQSALPLGPTHRHLLMRPALPQCLERHLPYLKVVAASNPAGAADFGAPNVPVVPMGQMQRPDWRHEADGIRPGFGFLRSKTA